MDTREPHDAESELPPRFSDALEEWLNAPGPKTIGGLDEQFAEKGFAVILLLLMILPATPLPTGGITHALEIIAIVVALQLVLG
ncbi:MAG: exopolysaccharide biosynthesis protein, partial [Actinomycetota bacterium]